MEGEPKKSELPDSIKNAQTLEELIEAIKKIESEGNAEDTKIGELSLEVARRRIETVSNMREMLTKPDEVAGMIPDSNLANLISMILKLKPDTRSTEKIDADTTQIFTKGADSTQSNSQEESKTEAPEDRTMIMSVGMFNESPSEEFKKVLDRMNSLDELAKWIDSQTKLPVGTRISTANTVRSLKQNWVTVLENKIPLLVRDTVLRLAEKEGYRDRIK